MRERVFYAAFISILFALAVNGAIFLLDQGISAMRSASDWRETIIALGLILVGVGVIAVTGLLWVSALQSLRLAWKMEREGSLVSGSVFKKFFRQNGRERFFHIIYDADSASRFEERVPKETYDRLNIGDKVILRTLPGHPDIARLELKEK